MQPGVHLQVTKLQMTRSHNTANHGATTCTRQASLGSASSLGFFFVLLETESHSAGQAGFHAILLPWPPESWDHTHIPTHFLPLTD